MSKPIGFASILECEGYGCSPAKYMFIGISAGRRGALLSKVPLTKDASGRLFQRCLGRLGLSSSDEFSIKPELNDTYITNLVKGRCLTENGLNRLPTDDEVAYWAPLLIDEIKKIQPKVLGLLGDFVQKKSVVIPWPLIRDKHIGLGLFYHPRWYASRGALKIGSPAFEQMVTEYAAELRRWD